MCGIAGIADSSGRPIEESVLHTMCDAIYHRGPDGEGFYFDTASTGKPGSVGLGMRRLAIVDLVTGQQPIHNEDKSIWVVLNGEIYNYLELKTDLESKGHSFYTRSDTEAIVHVYEEYGLETPAHLRGMFAFAIWDTRQRRLLVARDRVGKKPLLYSQIGGKLAFASEFQSLLKHPEISRDVNRQAIWDYLSFMCVPGPDTAFAGIKKLDPGSRLIWQNGEIKIDRYWSLDFTRKLDVSEAEAGERLLQLLKEAVKVRLMSDVPLGAFLSGGIDSSAVVAMMAELSPTRVKTFSIGFDEHDFSEIEHARKVANHFGTDHHEFVVRPAAIDVLPTLVRNYGEPYADSSAVPTYYLSKMARQHVTVALNGDGGDECFGGYERYAAMRMADSYRRLPRILRVGLVEPVVGTFPAAAGSRSRVTKARRFFDVAGWPRPERYLRWTSALSEELKAEIGSQEFLRSINPSGALQYVGHWFEGNGSVDVIDRVLKADTECYLPNDLLVKVDIASMAVSLEARSPFLDHHLMEFAASLPASYKVRGLTTKYLLKSALRGILPESNLKRSKMGFGVPIGSWLRGELKEYLAGAILSEKALGRGYFKPEAVRHMFDMHQAGSRDYGHQLWTLLMLELWHREFID